MNPKVIGRSEETQQMLRDGKGMFTLRCDNSRRRGFKQVQYLEAEGVQYSSGHIHVDTEKLPVSDFSSMQQMIDMLKAWGEVSVVWDEEEETP